MAGVPARVLDGLGEGLRTLAGPLLPPLVGALAGPLDQVDDLVTVPPGDWPAAPPLFDLATTPYPATFGQLAGVPVPPGTPVEVARELVRTRGVTRKGNPSAIIAAARTALTGTRRAVLLERSQGPDHFTVVTYLVQTPDPAAVVAAVAEEKPVGLTFDHQVRRGITWGELAQTGLTWAQARAYTWDELGLLLPPEQ